MTDQDIEDVRYLLTTIECLIVRIPMDQSHSRQLIDAARNDIDEIRKIIGLREDEDG